MIKYIYFKKIQFSMITILKRLKLNVITVLFLTIQFNMNTQFKYQTVLFDSLTGSYQVLSLWVRLTDCNESSCITDVSQLDYLVG